MAHGAPAVSDWTVPKGRRACDGCQRPFQPGDPLWSALVLAEGTLRRDDRCPDCHGSAPVADPLCRWRTTAPAPDQPRRTRLDVEAAAELLKRLVADPAHRPLCYVLALGLVRRRVLKIAGSEPGPAPTPDELAAEQAWRDAVAVRDAAIAAAAAPAADATPAGVPSPEPPPVPPPIPEVPPRPPPRPIGWLLLSERDVETPIRVAELALADDQIAAVTAELRELFEGEV